MGTLRSALLTATAVAPLFALPNCPRAVWNLGWRALQYHCTFAGVHIISVHQIF